MILICTINVQRCKHTFCFEFILEIHLDTCQINLHNSIWDFSAIPREPRHGAWHIHFFTDKACLAWYDCCASLHGWHLLRQAKCVVLYHIEPCNSSSAFLGQNLACIDLHDPAAKTPVLNSMLLSTIMNCAFCSLPYWIFCHYGEC